MKIKSFFVFLVAIGLIHNISFAQDKENSNPYAIFGSNPYIAGDKADGEHVKVFIIENIRDNSQIVRLEHNTETGIVTAFDNENMVVLQKKLKEGERAWLTHDRFAEKYYHLSPYSYGAGNPVNIIDINGDSLWITHNTGFLGLGGKQTLLYENGNLYNKDGTSYTGRSRGFLSKTVNALNNIRGTQEGGNMVGELQSSFNNFTIVKGDSKFSSNSPTRAYANQIQTDPALAGTFQALQNAGIILAGGSGGTISWNPSGAILPTLNGSGVNATTDLAHEMFHGLDANRGLLDNRIHQGIERSEWQAVYRG